MKMMSYLWESSTVLVPAMMFSFACSEVGSSVIATEIMWMFICLGINCRHLNENYSKRDWGWHNHIFALFDGDTLDRGCVAYVPIDCGWGYGIYTDYIDVYNIDEQQRA